MRWIVLLLAVAMAPLATAGDLEFQATGGEQLTVKARADQQKWVVLNERILVAAVVDGRLIVEDFNWPPGPQPTPPNPEPGPQPNPQPQPQPTPGPKTVLWIEESSQRTPSQAAAVIDAKIRQTIQSAGWKLRVVDVDVVDETGKPPADLAGYLDAARQAGVPRVFILQDGRELYAGAAPSSVSSFLDLLRRYGLPVGTPGDEPRGPTGAQRQPAAESELTETLDDRPVSQTEHCPTGQCPAPQLPTRRWRLFR